MKPPAWGGFCTRNWTRARDRAGLHHFHLHDLRHEATSRLAERGWNILELAAVTGHRDLQMLKRYTNLRAADLAKKMGWQRVLAEPL